jgi:hypothetical protein
MSWFDFGLSVGVDLLKAGFGYQAAKKEAKIQKQWQEYHNTMVRLADAQNQNAITANRSMAHDASAAKAFAIDRSEMVTEGAVEVSAASMGVTGRSVNMAIFDVQRNAAYAQQARIDDLKMQDNQFNQQRRQSAFSAVQNMDFSPIKQPNIGDYISGFATDLSKLWSANKASLKL